MSQVVFPAELWQKIAQDLKASGLTRIRYYHEKLAAFVGHNSLPSRGAFNNQMRRYLGATRRCKNNSVAIRSLSSEQILQALHPTAVPPRSKGGTTVNIAFANGTRIQFDSFCPEQLALAMHKISMEVC